MLQVCLSPCVVSALLLLGTIAPSAKAAAALSPSAQDRSIDYQSSDRLAVSTLTSISAVSLISGAVVNQASLQMSQIVQVDKYMIEDFSVSFKDNLALFGSDVIYAKPIGPGANYINTEGVKNLGIEFDGHFTVDWVDHNVYVFKENYLKVHSLLVPQYSAVIYNASSFGRNLVVEHKHHFIAWISNENNIMKATTDGSKVTNVWTQRRVPIQALAVSSINSRFYFAVNTVTKKTSKDLKKETKVVIDERSMILKKDEWVVSKEDIIWIDFLSIDYEAKFGPMREHSLKVHSIWTNVTSMARYQQQLYYVIVDFEDEKGKPADTPGPFRSYCLYQLNGGSALKLKKETNRPITSVQVAWFNPGSNALCQQKACPQMCMTVGNSAKCHCKDNAATCVATHTPPGDAAAKLPTNSPHQPNAGNNSIAQINNNPQDHGKTPDDNTPDSVSDNFKPSSTWIWIGVAVLILGSALIFMGYKYYWVSAAEEGGNLSEASTLSNMGISTAKMFGMSKLSDSPGNSTMNSKIGTKANSKGASELTTLSNLNGAEEEEKSWFQRAKDTVSNGANKVLNLFGFGTQPENEVPEETIVDTSEPATTTTTIKSHKKKNRKRDKSGNAADEEGPDTSISDTKGKKKKKKKHKHRKAEEPTTEAETTEEELAPKKRKKKKNKRSKERVAAEGETTTTEAEVSTGRGKSADKESGKKSKSRSRSKKSKKDKHKRKKSKEADKSPQLVSGAAKEEKSKKKKKRDSAGLTTDLPSLTLGVPGNSTATTKLNDEGNISSAIRLTAKPYAITTDSPPVAGQKKKKKKSKTIKEDEEIVTSDAVAHAADAKLDKSPATAETATLREKKTRSHQKSKSRSKTAETKATQADSPK